MGHTCEDCGETFATLTRLRLHDCPGPDPDDEQFLERIEAELGGDPDRGDVLSALPTEPLSHQLVDRIEQAETVHTIFSLFGGLEKRGTTERLAVATAKRGFILEYFPRDGWVVVRSVNVADHSNAEAALMSAAEDWQSTVTDLSLDYASGEGNAQKKLREELDWT